MRRILMGRRAAAWKLDSQAALAGVSEAIMVGRVTKTRMYRRFAFLQYIPDLRTARLFLAKIRRDKRPAAMLNAIADELASEGITLIDSTIYTPEQLTSLGVLTKRQPSEKQMEDAPIWLGTLQQDQPPWTSARRSQCSTRM